MDSYCSKIIDIYTEYLNWSKRLLRSLGGTKMFSSILTGGAEYKNREEHEEFFCDCKKAVEEYYAAIINGDTGREDLMPLLRYALLDCHSECDERAEWMLLAAEKHFLPFMELITREEAEELYEPYRKLRRSHKGLPPQDEILKKLKKKKI